MRTFKSFTREDVKEPVQPWDPSSEGEQRFKHLHNPVNYKDLVPGVTDQDHVFNGNARRDDPKSASYENFRDDDESKEAYDKNMTRKAKYPEKDKDMKEETLSAKAGRAGKDLGKPGKNFDKIASSAAKKYGSKAAGERVAGAILKKMRANEEVEQIEEVLDTPMKKLNYIAKNAYQVATADPAKMANDPKKANAIANRVIGAKRLIKKLNKEEVESIDEISLKTKINAFKAASDSEADYSYGSKVHAQADRIHGKIVAKHGRAAGDHANAAAYGKDVYGDRRDDPQKSDLLTKATSSTNKMRITKSGIANKQDQKTNANIIKSRIGKHGKSNIPEETVLEKHLTPAEMKKREVIAKAMGRENPKMDMAKKMAIATAQAKKVAESVTLDEKVNSQAFVKKYRENEEDNMHSDNVVHLAKHFGNSSDQKQALEIKKQHDKEGGLSRELGAKRNALHNKLWKKAEPHFDKVDKMKAYRADRDKHMEEEVQIDEISTKLALNYDKGASKSMDIAAAKGSAGHETFMKRSAGRALALDKTNPEHKRMKAKVGTTDANAKDAAYKKSIDEAKRGRPRKNPLPAGSSNASEEEGGREHIIVQYRKAERMPEKEIEHNDNSKHSFPKAHYKKALDMHLTMKPSEKETFEKRLAASKASALSAVAGEPAPKPKPKITLGGKMQKEAKDLDTKNVKSLVKHDCATHVKHGKFGEGRCVPEMHTIEEISEGVGYVTHYDVLFEHGIEKDVPVESLQILASEEHGHMPKKSMKEALIGNQKNIDANHNNKIDKQDFKILKGKEKFKKFSKMKESSEANMQQDSLEYSMEEKSLNNLYNSLSEENQAKFEELIETDPGFEQLLSFARKQGF